MNVVIDTGSGVTKAGFSGETSPRAVFPTIVGRRPHVTATTLEEKFRTSCVGDRAQSKCGIMRLTRPVQRGRVADFDELQLVWHHVLRDELRLGDGGGGGGDYAARERRVLVSVATGATGDDDRARMVQILLERLEVPGCLLVPDAVLALAESGRTTGLVVAAGEGAACTAAVYEGQLLPHTAVPVDDAAGDDVTTLLMQLLTDRGYSFTTSAEREIVRDIKERLARVEIDFDAAMAATAAADAALSAAAASSEFPVPGTVSYELPDGQVIGMLSELFRCTEPLFRPSLLGRDTAPVHEAAARSLRLADADLHRVLLGNVVLAGGGTLYAGFADRLRAELAAIVPVTQPVKLVAPPDRILSTWIGGSILASHSAFAAQCLSRAEYAEHGERIVKWKFG